MPKTGDDSNSYLLLTLCILSALCLVMLAVPRKNEIMD